MHKASVLVLGSGPAGLLACHAARLSDCKVTIISKKDPSFISGAQFLHTAIPALTRDEPDAEISFIKYGTEIDYAHKIYGENHVKTSWKKYPAQKVGVWHLQRWYRQLWDLYEYMIQDGVFLPGLLPNASTEFDVILSTIPIRSLFTDVTTTEEQVNITEEDFAEPGTIIYNGLENDVWYRASNLFGYHSVEYPREVRPPGPFRMILKPLSANVQNPYENVHMLGRYGKWEKGVLVDDAFREALKIVSKL